MTSFCGQLVSTGHPEIEGVLVWSACLHMPHWDRWRGFVVCLYPLGICAIGRFEAGWVIYSFYSSPLGRFGLPFFKSALCKDSFVRNPALLGIMDIGGLFTPPVHGQLIRQGLPEWTMSVKPSLSFWRAFSPDLDPSTVFFCLLLSVFWHSSLCALFLGGANTERAETM